MMDFSSSAAAMPDSPRVMMRSATTAPPRTCPTTGTPWAAVAAIDSASPP
ncbi:hypothetical protein [Paracidovorax cattleyae]|nr:hypothetical protein [Paracidovorax cattleyae]